MYSRLLSTVLAGGAAGTLVGLLEAWINTPKTAVVSGALINIGLVSPFGLLTALLAAPVLVLVFGAAPRHRIANASLRWRRFESAEAAARFAARGLGGGAALLALFVGTFHLAHFSVTTFHHEGLTALFIASLSLPWLLLVGGAARRTIPLLERLLSHKLSTAGVMRLARLSPFLVPVCLLVALVFAPKEGTGVIGFIGLLKREELELTPLVLASLPTLAAAGGYILLTKKHAVPVTLAAGVLAGIGIGSAVMAATRYDAFGIDAADAEQHLPLGGRLLARARQWSDGDGDGVSPLFGGGDCDDGDPEHRPGAIDIPGNGIDEDCSGEDEKPTPTTGETSAVRHTAEATAPSSENLSIILLTVDALRHDIGLTGYPRPITPNIDKLGRRGVVFERAYALSSYTGRALAPMFIGRYPSETYCNYSHFTRYSDQNEMLAETLKAAGFATVGIGSHFYFEKPSGLKQGFDRFYVEIPPGPMHIDQKTTSDWVANRAIQALKDPEFTKGRFFLWAHFMDPHRDYLVHRGFDGFGNTPRDLYDGEVAFTDHYVGKVLDTITSLGLDGRTIVMVTADHGEAFREHDVRYHGRRLWEEIVRVPWIMAIPGVSPRRVQARVSHHDLPATIYDLLGLEPPKQNRGKSLVSIISGKEKEDRRIFIDQPPGEYMEEVYALIDHGFKLIHTVSGNRFQLFDLNADPGEKTDLARRQPDKLEELKQLYRHFREGLEINAPRQ